MRLVIALLATSTMALADSTVAHAVEPDWASFQFSESEQALLRKPYDQWSGDDINHGLEIFLNLSHRALQAVLTPSERLRVGALKVELALEGEAASASLSGDTIRVSATAAAVEALLGECLGHDIFILSGEELPFPKALLTRPFAANQLLPLLDLSLDFTEWAPLVPQPLTRCPIDVRPCSIPQFEAMAFGIYGFLLAHEMGHALRGHATIPENGRPLAQELEADAKAWEIIQRLTVKQKHDQSELARNSRLALAAGPLLLLRWQSKEGDLPDMVARQEALRKLVPEDLGSDVDELVTRTSVGGEMHNLILTWDDAPDSIYINGVAVKPDAVRNKTLRVFGRQVIFATHQGRIAYHESRRVEGEEVKLVFLELRGGISIEELNRLRHARKWYDLLLATATAGLRPRMPGMAVFFNEALGHLGASRLIDPDLAGVDKPSDRRKLTRLRLTAGVLGTWR